MKKVSPHFLRLYFKTVRRYKKLSKRLKQQLSAGQFQQKSEYVQREFLAELHKLRKKLFGFKTQLRLATAAGVAALMLSTNTASAQLGPFTKQDRLNNPLREPLDIGEYASPAAADLDGDGDLDLLVGSNYNYGNNLRYYRNIGTPEVPVYQEETYGNNPAWGDGSLLPAGIRMTTPALGDLDGDGDPDLLVGDQYGYIRYFENTGSHTVTNDKDQSFDIPDFVEVAPWDSDNNTGNFFTQFVFGSNTQPLIVDFDNDGHMDVLVANYYDSGSPIRYFESNNDGTYDETGFYLDSYFYDPIRIATIDADGDTDLDLVVSKYGKYGDPQFFLNEGINVDDGQYHFVNQYSDNPFSFLPSGMSVSPLFVDLNNDGFLDLIAGTDFDKYGNVALLYYEGQQDGSFEQKVHLNSPFDGVHVGGYAAPVFTDIDGDDDLDVVISSSNHFNGLAYYRNNNGTFEEVGTEENPFAFSGIPSYFTPSFVDLNGDELVDMVGCSSDGLIAYYRNSDGSFTAVDPDPFETINNRNSDGYSELSYGKSDLADVDNDGDFDLVVSQEYYNGGYFSAHTSFYGYNHILRFFENTGDAQNPSFTELTGTFSPISTSFNNQEFDLYPRFVDYDQDGDIDLLVGEGGVDDDGYGSNGSNQFHILQNQGGPEDPKFYPIGDLIPEFENAIEPFAALNDFDNDGDVDIFQGDISGDIHLYANENPAPNTTINTSTYATEETSGTIRIDVAATVEDPDNDRMGKIVIKITNFNAGDTLTYPQPLPTGGGPSLDEVNPTHVFDDVTGTLTITAPNTPDGNSATHFERILQNLYYSFDLNAPSASVAPPRPGAPVQNSTAPHLNVVHKTLRIEVYDRDLTKPATHIKPLSLGVVNKPSIDDTSPITVIAGKSVTIDLAALVYDEQDADNQLTLTVSQAPANATSAVIDAATQQLTIDYAGKAFTGSETIKIRVRDTDGNSVLGTFNINVTNTAPVFNAGSGTVVAGGTATVNLATLFSDVDGNLVNSTLAVTAQPASGGVASISGTNLVVDYATLPYIGDDPVNVKICDITNTCASATITISVTNVSPTFSPGSGTVAAGGIATIDLNTLFSDADGNINPATLKVTNHTTSTATASFDASNNLVVDYTGVVFTGSDKFTVEVCDVTNSCASAEITINVTNTAPTLASGTGTVVAGRIASVDLLAFASDADDNLDLTSFAVVGTPTSGASPTIDATGKLIVDYSTIVFSGNDTYNVKICDDGAACAENSVVINVTNNAPSIASATRTIPFGGTVSIGLDALITDGDNNINPASLKVLQQPASGASASIDANNNLVVNYSGKKFAGADNLKVEVCDFGGSCAQAVFAVTVSNSAPIITATTLQVTPGQLFEINLIQFASDPDDNLDASTFVVVDQPISGATAEIVDGVLRINYDGVTFQGTDHLTIQVCDQAGACAEPQRIDLAVNVVSEVQVNNAVAPNGSSAENSYLHISGLPPSNHVTIFNRWGDKVYEAFNYDNSSVKFVGLNDNGNQLASGTYYYKIEYTVNGNADTKTGYLALKQ